MTKLRIIVLAAWLLALGIVSVQARAEVTCGAYLSQPAEGGVQGKLGDRVPYAVTHNATTLAATGGGLFDKLEGYCGGMVTAFADGSHVTGQCSVADSDGDVLMYRFVIRRGEKRGLFLRDGGSGKFAGRTETGWFEQTAQHEGGASGIWGSATDAACK